MKGPFFFQAISFPFIFFMVAVFIEKAMYMYATLLIFFYGKFFFINYLSNWVAVVIIIVADLFNLDRRVFFWSFILYECDVGRSI